MILASRQPNGKVVYFDARTGMERKPGRERGRHLGVLPPEAMRFLTPQPRTRRQNDAAQSTDEPTRRERREAMRVVPPEKPWSLSRFFKWIKSLLNGKK